jgi:hypothetical protein
MTRRLLLVNVFLVIAYVVLWIAIFTYFTVENHPTRRIYATIIKEMIPLIIAIPVAWLTTCFQKRNSFLTNLRTLYDRATLAIQSAIQYTHLPRPSQKEYAAVMKELAATVDLMRGSFKNIKEKRGKGGLYPLETLKIINNWVGYLGFGNTFKKSEAPEVRKNILKLWRRRLRPALFEELDRHRLSRFDSPFLKPRSHTTEKSWPRPPKREKDGSRSGSPEPSSQTNGRSEARLAKSGPIDLSLREH